MNPRPLRVLDLFSGIGGFSLGLERAGMKTVAFCEIDPFCRKVLGKHWPEVPIYEDIRELTASVLERDGIERPSVIAGGFPCQDISLAGHGAGIGGERSGLWREFARLIREIRPRHVLVENVSALLGRGIGDVLGDLAESGYDAEWCCVPAWAVGLPHNRDRVWIVAHAREERTKGSGEKPLSWVEALPWRENGRRAAEWAGRSDIRDTALCRGSDGVPNRVDRVGALGNSVVPAIVEHIGKAIMQVHYD